MGFLDSLKAEATKRAKSLFDDAGTSVKTSLTPKSPFPLSTTAITGAAETKARAGADALDAKVRSKATKLQDNTIGKVTGAVNDRVNSEVARAEKKVDDKVAAVEKDVDDGLDRVGKTVDGGIADTNKSLDKALGRTEAKDDADAPEVATVAAAEAKDGADAKTVPLASGFTRGEPTTRKRSNAVVIGAGRSRSNATAEPAAAEPEAAATVEDAKTDEPVADEIAADAVAETKAETGAETETDTETADTEQKDDGNSDEAIAADAEHDLDGLADSEAAARLAEEQKAAAELAAEEAAQAAGEQADDDVPEEKDDPKIDAEPELSEDELAAMGEQHKGETDDQDKARLEFKKKIRGIDNELRHLLGGGLTTKSTSKDTGDPWIAFFVASNKFKKKIALRDLKDELAGKKKDEPEAEEKPAEEVKTNDDGTPVVEEATGPESQDETEVELAGGSLRRGTASTTKGEPVDTTAPEVGSPEGRQIFVADKSHKLFIGYRPVKDNDHTQLLGLDEIVVGGEIRVEQGKIDFMSNDKSGDQETAEPFVELLRSLRDTGGIPMNFNVFEASKKNETTAEKLLEEADAAAPEPEQEDLLAAMKKSDAWKLLTADFSEELITQVAEKEGWKVAGDQIVDATGPLDPDAARLTLQKAAAKSFAAEAAAKIAARNAAKGAAATVDA